MNTSTNAERSRVVCDLPPHLLDALKREAAERNLSVSALLSILVWEMAVARKQRERDGLMTACLAEEM